MDLRGGRRSSNIEDRRGMSIGRTGAGLSIGGILFLVVLSMFGINPLPFLGMATQQSQPQEQQPAQPYQESADEAKLREVAEVTLGETETTWGNKFEGRYPAPTMVFYSDATSTGCGQGQSLMGPFYCPADQRVYLDLSFFTELEQRFGAPGKTAQAYVVAHEVGHHVQNVVGTAEKVRSRRERASETEANALSVSMELQADCYAGVWAKDAAARLQITPADMAEAMNAASAIGDDRLQRQSQGRVSPESFTHGSSEQRMRWLKTGWDSGDPNACDTFNSRSL